MFTTRIIASNPTTGDAFADFTATPADRRHYIANGYTVRTLTPSTTDDSARDLARFLRFA